MCGIAGYLRFDGDLVDRHMIDRMCKTMVHRGPDDVGVFVKNNIGIGMRRLSIIDLESGKQPISNEDDTVHIVFNGEIYNYIEIRQDLIRKNHLFTTTSDTEVIVHLYEEYGTGCLKYLNGMFAFAIWDDRKGELFCARDRLGVKPFYYLCDDRRLIFGSELKTILEEKDLSLELDIESLYQFLAFEFIPFPNTLFRTIKKLPPGHFLTVIGNNVRITQYWNASGVEEKERTEEETAEELYSLIKDSVRLRLRSDVPFGAFLSGGIDSSSVVALMSELLDEKVKTFSIGFQDESYNELDYARQVSGLFHTEHSEKILKPSAVELIESLIDHLDDPIGDFSVFPTYLVSKMTREKVKVALSGDGGDELFGGYDTYIAQKLYRYYSRIPSWMREYFIVPLAGIVQPRDKKKGIINKMKKFIEGTAISEEYDHFRWMVFLSPHDSGQVFTRNVANNVNIDHAFSFITRYLMENRLTGLNKSMYLDIKSYLVDNILVKVDRMSMANSLEVRTPFLDYRVVEFALSIPQDLKIKCFRTKYILRKIAGKNLPANIINKPKQGFSIPMKNWLKGPIKNMMTDLLSHERLKKQGIFNPDHVEKMIQAHLQNRMNYSHQIWSLMLFQLWKERFTV